MRRPTHIDSSEHNILPAGAPSLFRTMRGFVPRGKVSTKFTLGTLMFNQPAPEGDPMTTSRRPRTGFSKIFYAPAASNPAASKGTANGLYGPLE